MFLVLLLTVANTFAESNDSVSAKKSFFIIPHAAYQQETSWMGGVAYGYYFKSKDISRISSISGSMVYTLLNQFMFNLSPKLYYADKKGFLYANLNFRNYPDYYYGIGNKPQNLKIAYLSRNFNLTLQPQYLVSRNLYFGALLSFKTEKLITDSSQNILNELVYSRYGNAGWQGYNVSTLGLLAVYDSRDNQFYPSKGEFAKIILSAAPNMFGNTVSYTDFNLDMRKYQPVFGKHTLAMQLYIAGIYGENIPFQFLPTFGGRDLLRGFRQGVFRNNTAFLFQSEYRLPVYKKLKAAMFCSVGDVANGSDFIIDKLKVAYGAGLRYQINDARVHLRFDIAKNNFGEKLQFYITATEAF
ncbi:MAG: BamA/TamA family outer membrane protein [Paludibacter sp.]